MSLIQKDLNPGTGDQLLTLDTDTNLEWLNLTATANRSANEVLAGFGGFTTTHGFRYAIGGDIGVLYGHAGITKGLTEPAFLPSPNDSRNHTGIEVLLDLMNGKQYLAAPSSGTDSRIMSYGINGGDPLWFVRYLSLNITRPANSHTEVNPLQSLDYRAHYIGSYLVRNAS
ncbi:hypothetical protein W02_07970 [Nitrospira sp. KM1]|nr:hypothetical protein W02_07970 [Nitrospira sp. KM1]